MVIKVRCRCGRGIKVRDSAAGKRVRCPECSKPVSIPEPEVEDFDDYADGPYGDDAYGDDPYAQPAAPPPARRRKSAASGKRSSRGKMKSSGGGSKLPLIVGGGIAAAVLLIGGVMYAILSGGDSVAGPDLAAGSPDQSTAAPATGQTSAAANSPSSAAGGQTPPSGTPANPAAEANQNSAPVAAMPPETTPQTTMTNGSQLWVVLSDFKAVSDPQSIGKKHQVNYRIAAGAPEAGKAYVLYIGASTGIMERFLEVPVDLQQSGTVDVPSALGMTGEMRAYLAVKKGRREWEPVSGEIAIGGQATSLQRPPTVVEAAGAAAQGKALALANARFEQARIGRMAMVVDYVLQQKADMGQRYILVVSGGGDNIEADVTMDLMRATAGKKGQFGISVMPGRSFPSGDLKVHVETRKSRIRREPGTAASNTVSVQR